MRILCITSQRASLTNVRPEAEIFIGLQARGCDVTVMTEADSDYAPIMREAGITVVDFHTQGKFDRAAISSIRTQLTSHDIVYAFNNNAIANTVRAARGSAVKVVTYRGQTGNISRWDPFAYLTHLHPRVDRIICVADAVRRSLVPQLRNPDKAVTVYKGHNPDWYADIEPVQRAALGIPADAVALVCVSNYRPRKGIEYLLESLADAPPDLHLVLAGAGTDADKLQQLAAKTIGTERLHALGYLEDVLPLTRSADIAVLPALRREGLPKTVIEAMACARPVIVTDTGGNAELVADGETGIVVAPGDRSAMGAAVSRLASDASLRERMGAAGRERIARHFNVGQTIEQTYAVFSSLLENKG
ncbi:MAG: glycosyltransferase family 4 protein [Gammaproteobacteria bacterium]|nr:glycosyltransferase family 4 protein [Gammaproteobacteria bacterium]